MILNEEAKIGIYSFRQKKEHELYSYMVLSLQIKTTIFSIIEIL